MKKLLIFLANLFFIFYILEAVAGIVDVPYTILMNRSLPLSTSIYFVFIALCFLFYFISGFLNVFPKRYFLPLTLFPIFSFMIMFTMTFPYVLRSGLTSHDIDMALFYKQNLWFTITIVLFNMIQLYIAIWFIKKIRRKALDVGQSLISLKGIFLFVLFNLFIILPILLVYGHANIVVLADNIAGDYMRSDPMNLYSVQKTFKKGTEEVDLIGMIHIGGSDFYRELSKGFKGKDSVVLAEGVSDREGLLKSKVSYQKVSKALGIGAQEKDFRIDTKEVDIIRADLDTSDFNKDTLEFINRIFSSLNKGDFTKLLKMEDDPELMKKISEDLLIKRNKKLISVLDENMKKYNRFFIPWGALHLSYIQKELEKEGFIESKDIVVRKVISYPDIYKNVLNSIKKKDVK